jgi:hypothetical protein
MLARLSHPFLLAALAALAGCNSGTAPSGDKADGSAPQAATPAAPASGVLAARDYLCDDGSRIHVDFLADEKSATVRDGEAGPAVTVRGQGPGVPWDGEGLSLSGHHEDRMVMLTRAGKTSQGCKDASLAG